MDETEEIQVEKSKTHWVNLSERIYQKIERLKEETGCRTTKEMTRRNYRILFEKLGCFFPRSFFLLKC